MDLHLTVRNDVTIDMSKTYALTIDGMTMHNILSALMDAERVYRKAGYTEMAENAIKAHQAILNQIPEA